MSLTNGNSTVWSNMVLVRLHDIHPRLELPEHGLYVQNGRAVNGIKAFNPDCSSRMSNQFNGAEPDGGGGVRTAAGMPIVSPRLIFLFFA